MKLAIFFNNDQNVEYENVVDAKQDGDFFTVIFESGVIMVPCSTIRMVVSEWDNEIGK